MFISHIVLDRKHSKWLFIKSVEQLMSQRMYGSTTACSVNVASTSNIPHNQSQQQNSGNTLPNAPLYYVPQLPTDAFGQQIIQYGDSAFGQENAYPSKDISVYTVRLFCDLKKSI
jgi:hypothetical protein